MNVFSEEMSIFIKLIQFFGLFPSNIFLQIYSLLNFVGTFVIFISAFYIFPVLREENSLSILVGGLVFVGILLTHLMNIFQAFTSRKQQAEIYHKFDDIDMLFSHQILVNSDYRIIRRRLFRKYLTIAIILMIIHTFSIVSVTIDGLFFRYYIHLIFPVIVIRFRCIQSMFYVDVVREKLELLNEKLNRDIIQKGNGKIIMVVEKFQAYRKKAFDNSLYDTILAMKTIYGSIWDITNLCNDCLGYSLLFIVSSGTFQLITS